MTPPRPSGRPRKPPPAKAPARLTPPAAPRTSTVSPARRAAWDVVLRTLADDAYADRALTTAAEGLEPRDRALAKQLAFGAVQRRGTLDWVISRMAPGKPLDPPVRAALHLGIYEQLFLTTADHASVDQAVELAKPNYGYTLVNAVLRRLQREPIELPPDDTIAGAAVHHSHPQWLVALWWKQLGAETTRALLKSGNEPAELALRINTLAAGTYDEADLPPGRREDDALVVDGPFDVAGSSLFRAGVITPQSRAAQRVSAYLAPQPGERVLDLCAAPGGKSTHLAALMGDTGTVVAVERHPGRARALGAACARMHATCVEVVTGDAKHYATDELFDRVLVDPPCSGLGTLRTHPDLRWRMTPEAIDGLVVVQDAILAAAQAALKPGGTLVYSTCTISAAEDRLQSEDRFQTLPHVDGTDGFSVARVSSST
ncbi:Ribosomal RNA small subunit methyltransferase B [Paraconexibacter sp. AEG42_29]|uniref:Ribosomal RNA small subunit methyltransferase B n=1 Tax=Paraconexibacter sp. AEG42_29 TaxID=2997339 RepID=A0AAU7AUJ8_9ACTN